MDRENITRISEPPLPVPYYSLASSPKGTQYSDFLTVILVSMELNSNRIIYSVFHCFTPIVTEIICVSVHFHLCELFYLWIYHSFCIHSVIKRFWGISFFWGYEYNPVQVGECMNTYLLAICIQILCLPHKIEFMAFNEVVFMIMGILIESEELL